MHHSTYVYQKELKYVVGGLKLIEICCKRRLKIFRLHPTHPYFFNGMALMCVLPGYPGNW